jgi:hypothetical protein
LAFITIVFTRTQLTLCGQVALFLLADSTVTGRSIPLFSGINPHNPTGREPMHRSTPFLWSDNQQADSARLTWVPGQH